MNVSEIRKEQRADVIRITSSMDVHAVPTAGRSAFLGDVFQVAVTLSC